MTNALISASQKEIYRARIPHAVVGHSAVGFGKFVIVYGGMITQTNVGNRGGKNFQKCSNHILVLDTEKMSWLAPKTVGPDVRTGGRGYEGIPNPSWKMTRSEHSATVVGDEMVVIGGYTTCNPNLNVIASSYVGDVQILNLNTMEWRCPPITRSYSPPTGQHCTVVTNDGDLWVIGGRNHATETVHQFAILNVGPDKGGKSKPEKKISVAKKTEPAAPSAKRDVIDPPREVSTATIHNSRDTEPILKPLMPSKQLPAKSGRRGGWGKPVTLSFGKIGSRENEPQPSITDSNSAQVSENKSLSRLEVAGWDEAKVYKWLSSVDGVKEKTAKCLLDEDFDGKALLDVSKEDLRSIGVTFGQAKTLLAAVGGLR